MPDTKKKYKFKDSLFTSFKCAPGHAAALLARAVLDGFVPVLQVAAFARIIDLAAAAVRDGTKISGIYLPIFYMILLMGYKWISEELVKFSQIKINLCIRSTFRVAVIEKIAKLNYSYIEDNRTWDLIKRVLKNPEDEISGAFTNVLSLAALMINVITILALILAYVWWAALLISGLMLPLCYLASKGAKENYGAEKSISENMRRCEYLGEILTGRDAAEERTLFGFSQKVNSDFEDYYETAYKVRLKVNRKWFLRMKTGSFAASIASVSVILIFINPVLTGKISVGLFISMINAFFNLIQQMSWDFTHCIDRLAAHNEYLKDLNTLLSLDETEGATDLPAAPAPALESVEFKNVRFRYPGSESYVLDGISFVIENGKHYAFVGINGAGKTTITKLLTGLYGDYEGSILINGRELKSYSQSVIKSIVSVLNQDFAKYFITLKDNIAVGNINHMHSEGENKRLADTIDLLGLWDVIGDLPEGVDTPLGKIKADGQDLSGGQWQRVAIARSLVNSAPLKILDEPTASLDPVNESKLYEEYGKFTENHTTILISHRLGSTKLADVIFVIEGGKIVESGTHNRLMNNRGVYSAMFNSQKDWYAV